MKNSTPIQDAKLKQKSSSKLSTEENFINLIKYSYQKSTAHIILKGGKLESSPLSQEQGKDVPSTQWFSTFYGNCYEML